MSEATEARQRRFAPASIAAVAAIVVVAAIALSVFAGGGGYEIKARFTDSGQLVKGGLVTVAGRPVGTIKELNLTDDNQAEIVLSVDEDRYTPLRRGTRAQIRTVGLSGITNRFVEISPGPTTGEEIPDGGTLSTQETVPVVDLDQVLNALDPPTRDDLQTIIKQSAKLFEGDEAADANRTLALLNPAVAQTRALVQEVMFDQPAFEQLLKSSADVVSALASRREDLQTGLSATSQALQAIASERDALQSSLSQAPATLRQGEAVLRRAAASTTDLRAVLRDLRPAARPLATVLRLLPPTSKAARPVLADLRSVLPELASALQLAPGLRDVAVPAVKSTTIALRDLIPVAAGLRPYAPAVVHGLMNGLGGATAHSYDANGHYARIAPLVGTSGITASVATLMSPGHDARCPGASYEPGPDGSNPYVEDASACDRADDHKGRRR